MSDQCEHCKARGSFLGCLVADCNIHDSWVVKTLAKELDESRAYADKLVEHFANGSLPKDVELLREANAEMAQELHELKTKPFAGMHEGCVAFLKLPVKLKSLDALNTFIKLAYGKECFVKEETGWLQVAKQGEA